MTHEELMTKIKTGNEFLGVKYAPDSHTFALRAVVELHKPTNHTYESGKQQVICSVCGWRGIELYPCPTIQAIEKELR